MTGFFIWLFIVGSWFGIAGALAAIADLTAPRLTKQQRIVERVTEFQRRDAA